MSEAKHTAGPWRPEMGDDGSFMIEDDSARVLCSRAPWYSSMIDESNANAQLIAAAPDLLASCKEFLPVLERQLQSINPDGAAETSVAFQVASERLDRMRAAIAKAEGRS